MNFKDVRTLIVSPHQDDIALSLGGTILSGFFAKPILVINFFTKSSYAPLYPEERSIAKISEIRAKEDDAFAKRVDLEHLDLSFDDALLRWKSNQKIFPLLVVSSLTRGWPPSRRGRLKKIRQRFAKVPITTKARILQKVAKFDRMYVTAKSELSAIFLSCPNATVVSPLSLASQPDHVAIACACRDIELRKSRRIYYEDLPYAGRYRVEEIPIHVTHFDKDLVPKLIDIGPVFDEKIKNLGLYRSQLDPAEIEAVIMHAKRINSRSLFERMWIKA